MILEYNKTPGYFNLSTIGPELRAVIGDDVIQRIESNKARDWLKLTLPDGVDTLTINQVIDAHDSSIPSPGQAAQIILEQSRDDMANIPVYATWSEADADAWYQTNVRDAFDAASDFASMKAVVGTMITVLWALIRMVFALRNNTWPDLQE